MQRLTTRLTERWGLKCPIVLAPMALASGGKLAATVSHAGGLGLIGGGYGNQAWLQEQFGMVGSERVGVGFNTWSLQKSPSLLTEVLKHQPFAVMLSFGDPRLFAEEIHKAGAKLICQCQNMTHVKDAIEASADAIVAQGAEAGGHGISRGTFSFVPEVADYLHSHAKETLLLAAGGVADGRGLAAALMLGADGVLVGTRLWASQEALVHQGHLQAILRTDGDGTVRNNLPNIVRQLTWPPGFTIRIRRNAFTERWSGREDELRENIAVEGPRFSQAFAEGDAEKTAVIFGEAAGLVHNIEPAADIVDRMASEAAQCLRAKY